MAILSMQYVLILLHNDQACITRCVCISGKRIVCCVLCVVCCVRVCVCVCVCVRVRVRVRVRSVSKPSYQKDILPLRIDAALSASQSYSDTHDAQTLFVCVFES